ncbi:MAG: hypothetical protein BWY71_01935 [Planctomycetes bacterium ADurb.Bin412]|nr:MAG: hypothetical protein BWY71_01935 [Planctomycetes bacterium ADurb.Bin412]
MPFERTVLNRSAHRHPVIVISRIIFEEQHVGNIVGNSQISETFGVKNTFWNLRISQAIRRKIPELIIRRLHTADSSQLRPLDRALAAGSGDHCIDQTGKPQFPQGPSQNHLSQIQISGGSQIFPADHGIRFAILDFQPEQFHHFAAARLLTHRQENLPGTGMDELEVFIQVIDQILRLSGDDIIRFKQAAARRDHQVIVIPARSRRPFHGYRIISRGQTGQRSMVQRRRRRNRIFFQQIPIRIGHRNLHLGQTRQLHYGIRLKLVRVDISQPQNNIIKFLAGRFLSFVHLGSVPADSKQIPRGIQNQMGNPDIGQPRCAVNR